MSLLRRGEKQTLGQILSIGLMSAGIVVLFAALVGAFVLVPVFLFRASQRKEAEAAEENRRVEIKTFAEERKPAPSRAETAKAAEAPKPAVPEPPKALSRAAPPQIPAAPGPDAAPAVVPKDGAMVDAEGFIRNWLVLAPIRSAQQPFSGALEIQKAQLPNEARLRAKEGDRAAFPDKERAWQKVASTDFFLDFQKVVGAGRSDDAIAYAVCYVHAPQAMSGLKLQMGSNDQGKVYLNGAQLLVFDKTRALAKDQNTANDVQLRKGENLLVFKVVNEKGAWQGCIRFTDRNNQPVRNLQISLTPQ